MSARKGLPHAWRTPQRLVNSPLAPGDTIQRRGLPGRGYDCTGVGAGGFFKALSVSVRMTALVILPAHSAAAGGSLVAMPVANAATAVSRVSLGTAVSSQVFMSLVFPCIAAEAPMERAVAICSSGSLILLSWLRPTFGSLEA